MAIGKRGGSSDANSGGYLTAAERKQQDARLKYERARRVIRWGKITMITGAGIGFVHLLGHFGAFGAQPTGLTDLLVGYPTAAMVILGGAIMAGQ